MGRADQGVREAIIAAGLEQAEEQLYTELERIDARNSARLKVLVEEYGWPGRSLVGEEAATAAFLIVQHAAQDLDFQEKVLALLEPAVNAGEALPRHFAMLTDRVLLAKGRSQLYGTQVLLAEGEMRVEPVEDEANLEERRARLGLEPMEEYLANLKEAYGLEAGPP